MKPLLSCLLLAGTAGLFGCASAPSAPEVAASGKEWVTESDEPEAQRRARQRLHHATGKV